ncbi:pol polyprotein [Striga asiatica]|uniref:Pol polyprotein n=1 Tax=Striga asiatica TaxID=4170 RepID=A0A5A7P0A3_STRAF|nr:pol polyprotein [Striga asiatica]
MKVGRSQSIYTSRILQGWMLKRDVELAKYNTKFEVRRAIKAQDLASFIQECTVEKKVGQWLVYVDGSSTIRGVGVGALIITPKKDHLKFAVKLSFTTSNNKAKYEALLEGIQVKEEYEAKNERCKSICPKSRSITLIEFHSSILDQVMEVVEQEDWKSPRRSYVGPHLHYMSDQEEEYVLREVHEGLCSNQIKAKALMRKVWYLRVLVFDNGAQFKGQKITTWSEDIGISQHFASVAHP